MKIIQVELIGLPSLPVILGETWQNAASRGPFHKYSDLVDLGWSAGMFVFWQVPHKDYALGPTALLKQ